MIEAALKRGYTNSQGKFTSYLQGKVIFYDGEFIYYRDINRNASQLYRDNSWNMDHLIYRYLKENEIENIYYFEKKTNTLYKTTIRKVENSIGRDEAYKEKLNNHTQYFLPRGIFTRDNPEDGDIKRLSNKWISRVVDVATQLDQKPVVDKETARKAWKAVREKMKSRLASSAGTNCFENGMGGTTARPVCEG